MAGNGSDELLSILMRCYVGEEDTVAYPVPTYSLYETLIAIQDGRSLMLPYSEDFAIPAPLYSQSSKVTILCNPNAPSGDPGAGERDRPPGAFGGRVADRGRGLHRLRRHGRERHRAGQAVPEPGGAAHLLQGLLAGGNARGAGLRQRRHRAQHAQGQGLLQPLPSEPDGGAGGPGRRGVDEAERRADPAHPQDADPGPAQAGLRRATIPGQLRDGEARAATASAGCTKGSGTGASWCGSSTLPSFTT